MRRLVVLLVVAVMILMPLPSFASSGGTTESAGIFRYIFDFIVSIFIPPEGYFIDKMADLSERVNAKLGSVGYLYQLLNNFFTGLSDPGSANLTINIPSGYFFSGSPGSSSDLLSSSKPYLSFFRAVTTVALAIFTAMGCYRNLRDLFPGGGESG